MTTETCAICGWGIIPRYRWRKMPIESREAAREYGMRAKYRNGLCIACKEREGYVPRRDDSQEAIANRLEDARWMAETGECMSGAAERLGLSAHGLDVFLRRHSDDPTIRTALLAREPRDHNRVTDGRDVTRWMPNAARDARNQRHNEARRMKRRQDRRKRAAGAAA